MKKTYLSMAVAATLASSMMFTSCIGSFSLTNKLLTWNQSISNKFVNELVFVCFWILPVYEVSGLADVLVLNSIEFWSGVNPVAQGKTIIEGNDGKYLCECDGKGYTITSQNDGSKVRLDFHADDRSWSLTDAQGQTVTLFSYVDDTHINMLQPDGSYGIVELSQQGLYAYQAAANAQLALK